MIIATRPPTSPPATATKIVVLEDVRGAAEGLVAALVEGGYRPVVGSITWNVLLSATPIGNAATIAVGHLVTTTMTAVCTEIRRREPLLPLICVIGSCPPEDAVRLLECGADDVLPRQMDRHELRARLSAHLRRGAMSDETEAGAGGPVDDHAARTFGGVVVDSRAREVRVGGRPVKLGRLEFELVEYLSRNAGVALSWDQLATQLYGYDADVSIERLEVLVRRVRAKLAAEGNPATLVAVPGWGYRWERRLPVPEAVSA